MSGVNRILCVVMCVVGCHLGRPPVQVQGVSLGELKVRSVEPGLKDSLRQAMSDQLAARGLLSKQGPTLDIEVLEATTSMTTVGASQLTATARLKISVRVGPAPGRAVVLKDERTYMLSSDAPLAAAAARAGAFSALCATLSGQAVSWISYAPIPESK